MASTMSTAALAGPAGTAVRATGERDVRVVLPPIDRPSATSAINAPESPPRTPLPRAQQGGPRRRWTGSSISLGEGARAREHLTVLFADPFPSLFWSVRPSPFFPNTRPSSVALAPAPLPARRSRPPSGRRRAGRGAWDVGSRADRSIFSPQVLKSFFPVAANNHFSIP